VIHSEPSLMQPALELILVFSSGHRSQKFQHTGNKTSMNQSLHNEGTSEGQLICGREVHQYPVAHLKMVRDVFTWRGVGLNMFLRHRSHRASMSGALLRIVPQLYALSHDSREANWPGMFRRLNPFWKTPQCRNVENKNGK
jgi:hypothetical protein